MNTVDWLMIGGPLHGKKLRIKAGSQIRYPHDDGEDYLYVAQTIVHEGKDYRLGMCFSEGVDRYSDDMIATMVQQSGMEPMPPEAAQGGSNE